MDANKAQASVTITLPSGQKHNFELAASAIASRVFVRESQPGHMLPAFCPDRHINGDGTFCLGWGPQNPNNITDEVLPPIQN
ncbi:MAG TPA: hypothetical protein PK743_08815 [Luteimonas sp.]|nr:hypothetical protein [Luteimonas sp.]